MILVQGSALRASRLRRFPASLIRTRQFAH
jgi:hypothetical protein